MPKQYDLETGHVPQDLDAPVQHPGVSTERDGETSPVVESAHSHDDSDYHSEHTVDTIDEALPEHPVGPNGVETKSATSRAASVQSRMSIISRGKRRGLLGRFTIVPEVERPHEYGRRTKWFITFLIALAAAAAPMGSAIFYRE